MRQLMLLILASVFGGCIALGGYQLLTTNDKSSFNEKVNYSVLTNVSKNSNTANLTAPDNFTKAAEKGMPAVVHITAKKTQNNAKQEQRGGGYDDFFRDFFGNGFFDIQPMPQEGTGSGVIISKDGYIVTNNHVIDFADEVSVTLHDQRKFTAKVIGKDPTTDVAVIKIEDNDLPTLNFSNSDNVKVGEWVLAVGNPFNLTSTVTAGIVSAKGRDINILQGNTAIESFIQTDAAVNPGNSGGALIDLEGDLIGINTAIKTRTGSFAGYSFAIPSNIVQKIVDDIIEFGEAQRGFIGINIANIDSEDKDELNLNISEGVLVESVVEDGAAIKAGVLPYDIITAVNGQKVKTAPELQELVGRLRPGDEVDLKIIRKSKTKNIKVRLQK